MLPILFALLSTPAADAAGIDLLEIGGMYGSPGAENSTAVWWNPANLSAEPGTSFLFEGAPTFADISFDRTHDVNGGLHEYKFGGLVPFLGVKTDFGIDGLGFGASLSIPQAVAAASVDPDGPGRMHTINGSIQVIQATVATSYRPMKWLSFGASAGLVHSEWGAQVDSEYATALADEIIKAIPGTTTESLGYTDLTIEDPAYSARATFDHLSATGMVFGGGIAITPIEALTVSASFNSGWTPDHRGKAFMDFGCPPDSDIIGRFGAEDKGLCNADLQADAQIKYRLPSRFHGAITVRPTDRLRLEGFGGYVRYSEHQDLGVALTNVESVSDRPIDAEAAHEMERQRLWARDAQDTFFAGVDAKYKLGQAWTIGGRLTFDNAAIPDHALSPNNIDTDRIVAGGLVAMKPVKWLELGVSFMQSMGIDRHVTDSAFSMAIKADERPEDRWNYPSANGTYSIDITRIGLSVRGTFDGKRKGERPAKRKGAIGL